MIKKKSNHNFWQDYYSVKFKSDQNYIVLQCTQVDCWCFFRQTIRLYFSMQQHNVYFYQQSLQYHYRPVYLLLLQSVFCQQVISILRILLQLSNYFKGFLHKIEDVYPSCAPALILHFVHRECMPCQCT